MYIDYLGWTLDFTGPQMLLTIKFTFYAFDVHDYRLNAEQLDKYAGPASTDPTKRNFLREYIVSARLPREPSALEYFGYIFFFPTFLAGPVQSVKSYMNYMDRTSFAEVRAPQTICVISGSDTRIFIFGGSLTVWRSDSCV